MGIKLGEERQSRYKLYVVGIQNGYMTLIKACSINHAERLGKQLVIERFYDGVHEATEEEIKGFQQMGGRMP